MVGDRLRVVAGAHGDHAALALVSRERQQLVQRAALLERGGELQVLELEAHLGAGERDSVRLAGQGVRSTAPAMRCRGGADGVEGHHGVTGKLQQFRESLIYRVRTAG